MNLTRRHAILAGTALPLAAPALLRPRPARAQEDDHGQASAVPPFPLTRQFRVDDLSLTVLLAGAAQQDNPHGVFGLDVDDATFREVSEANFIPADRTVGVFQPTLVTAGDARILFDAGMVAGGTLSALQAAGLGPSDVTHVVLTHMHPDHIGGLADDAGNPTFPDAAYLAGRAEFDFWAAQGDAMFESRVRPFEDRMTFLAEGDEVAPGIATMETFGHTPGHLSFLLDGGGERVLIAGDLVNHHVWSLQHPDWEVLYDSDKAAAAATRRRVLGMLAEQRIAMQGYHLPNPGLGFVEARGDGFFWVPVSYQFT